MNKRFYIILTILTIGFFLMPSEGYACETKTEKSCCKKNQVQVTDKKDCCSKKQDKSCNGKCGHSNCTTSTSINFAVISLFEISFKNNIFDLITQKSNFYHSETFISSGFTSVWLPPKI